MKNNNHKLTGGAIESGPRQRRSASVRISRRWGEWGEGISAARETTLWYGVAASSEVTGAR
jgi:hypothetical protein